MHKPIDCSTAESILAGLQEWQRTQTGSSPMSDEAALARLKKENFSDEDIAERLEKLRMNGGAAPPRYITNYTDLQGVNHLEEACNGWDLTGNPEAATIRAVLQAAEIALLNIRDLAPPLANNIHESRFFPTTPGRGMVSLEEHYAWITSFQNTLRSLGDVLGTLPASGEGCTTSIADSPQLGPCFEDLNTLHRALIETKRTEPINILRYGTDINHQNFVDTTTMAMWEKALGRIHIPGVQPEPGQTPQEFYKKFVGTDALNLAVNELDQVEPAENFLRQFRAYHQISEILAAQVNRLFASSITALLDPNTPPMEAKEHLDHALKMLDIVNRDLEPIATHLSFHEYRKIRGSLGATSGSDSPNLRGALFAPLYQLLVGAVEQRALGFTPCTPEERADRLQHIVTTRNKDPESFVLYGLLQDTLDVHQHINAWRNAHLQFIKTQIGHNEDFNTASIKGTKDAYTGILGFFKSASERDPIGPIYAAITGKEYIPEILPTTEFPYATVMAGNTANAVKIFDSKVERRVNKDGTLYAAYLDTDGKLVPRSDFTLKTFTSHVDNALRAGEQNNVGPETLDMRH